MTSNLIWSKYGENQGRAYRSKGKRVTYRIGLDPVSERWVLSINSIRSADNLESLIIAKEMAETYESAGAFVIPAGPNGAVKAHSRSRHASDGYAAPGARSSVTAKSFNGHSPASYLDSESLADQMCRLIRRSGISPQSKDAPWQPWTSGVYALLDCVFRARMNYDLVVLPMLGRLAARPGLADHSDLTFSAFVSDIDGFGPNKFVKYANEVLTRNKLAGRLKVEITYDVCRFFIDRRIETIADMHKPSVNIETLILDELQAEVHGIGPALCHYLLTLAGFEDHVKLDPLIIRFWARMNTWVPRPSQQSDYTVVINTFREVAACMGTTPARLDHAIWHYESGN